MAVGFVMIYRETGRLTEPKMLTGSEDRLLMLLSSYTAVSGALSSFQLRFTL